MRLVDLLLAPLSFTRTLWISLCFCHAYGFLSLQSRSFVYKELQELLPRVKRRIAGIRRLNRIRWSCYTSKEYYRRSGIPRSFLTAC